MRWVGPKHWPIGFSMATLIWNAMAVGATASALRDHSASLLDLVVLPLNALLVVWIASAIQAKAERS